MNDMLKTTPDFSIDTAAALLAEHYGLSGTLSPLASERDQNFKVETAEGTFILKIVNAAEPEVESDFQTALLAHLGAMPATCRCRISARRCPARALPPPPGRMARAIASGWLAGSRAGRSPRRNAAMPRSTASAACSAVSMRR